MFTEFIKKKNDLYGRIDEDLINFIEE